MTDSEFIDWATRQGVDATVVEQIVLAAATEEEMKAAYDAIEVPPPIYSLADIRSMTESKVYGFSPLKHGMMIVGGCPNGDPIAIDLAENIGSVLYIDHTSMHRSLPREIAIRVATDLDAFISGLCNENDFPIDHFSATQRRSRM